MNPVLLLAAAGAAGLGLLALTGRAQGSPSRSTSRRHAGGGLRAIVANTLRTEGGQYDSINPNRMGGGLEYGLLQWSQAGGGLGRLLQAMYSADPRAFVRVFGPQSAALLNVTTATDAGIRMSLVGGQPLWSEPWLRRFREAARVPAFRKVQDRLLAAGPEWQAAKRIAAMLGTPTDRALALYFDTAVHQGAGRALQHARTLAPAFRKAKAPYQVRLAFYRVQAGRRFDRANRPRRSRLPWRRVGKRWHAFRGNLDLWQAVRNRTGRILADKTLSDARST